MRVKTKGESDGNTVSVAFDDYLTFFSSGGSCCRWMDRERDDHNWTTPRFVHFPIAQQPRANRQGCFVSLSQTFSFFKKKHTFRFVFAQRISFSFILLPVCNIAHTHTHTMSDYGFVV